MFIWSARWLDQLEAWNRPNMNEQDILDEEIVSNEEEMEQTEIDGLQLNYSFHNNVDKILDSTEGISNLYLYCCLIFANLCL